MNILIKIYIHFIKKLQLYIKRLENVVFNQKRMFLYLQI